MNQYVMDVGIILPFASIKVIGDGAWNTKIPHRLSLATR
jgi:hypothetical protein